MSGDERIPLRTDQGAVPTILVVAHDLKFLKLLKLALEIEFECVVLSITSGRSAVETAERTRPDLLIIDAYLLDIDTLELADRLHSIKELERVPTLLLNSLDAPWSKPQGDHTISLRGPFATEDFYTAVNKCLGRTR